MEINITALDYFRELELMEKQYGQEEDLYPWIYMLLQMALQKKSNGISIRDVHNALKAKELKNREQIKGETSFPDFVVFKKEDPIKPIGCVEIKKMDLNNRLFPENTTIKKFKLKNGVYLQSYLVPWKKSRTIKHEEITETQFNKFKDNPQEIEIFLKNKNIEYKEPHVKKLWKCKTTLSDYMCRAEDDYEIVGHLQKFKKVLYTNGLGFYYLKLVDNQIEVECLADLTDYFYKMNEKSWTTLADEWAKLIKELPKIDWYEDPTVKSGDIEQEKEEENA